MLIDKEKIYQEAIDLWGINSQMIKTIEEMSELTSELCHELYDKGSIESIIEELADVEIMIEQMKAIFPSVEAIKNEKLKRLALLIDREKKEH